MIEFLKEVNKLNIGKVEKDVSLSKYTTYRVGGVAKAIIYPKNTEKLIELINLIKKYNYKYKMLGNGSNLLFSDNEYDGVLIKLSEFNNIEIHDNKITVGAGFPLIKLSQIAMKNALTGLEFAAGIPGTIGGAIFMNAGAYKSDMGYIVKSVKVLTPDMRVISLSNSEMDFHYRTSFLQKNPDYICLEVNIKLNHGDKNAIEKVLKDRRERRMLSQPLEYPSAGSVFRNPSDEVSSGKLIDDLGLKGLTKGGAEVSVKHANFIINKNNATAKDIKELILFVKKSVKDNYGIDLKIEQEFVNWE